MKLYQEMLDASIAKECARFVLPLAVPTKIYMTGSVRSWIHYIQICVLLTVHRRSIWILHCLPRDIFCEQFPAVAEAMDWTK